MKADIPRRFHHIRADRARRRQSAGAPAIEHRIAHRVAADKNRIEHITNRGQRMRFVDKCRMNPGVDAFLVLLGNRQQFDDIVQFAAIVDIFRLNPGDAFHRDIFQ